MKNTTNRLLVLSILLAGITLLVTYFWTELGLDNINDVFIGFAFVLIYSINVAGFVYGIFEKKLTDKKAIIGFYGNLFFVGFYILIFAISCSYI